MGKSSPSGNTTVTQNTVNPVSQAQLPFLQSLWTTGQGNITAAQQPGGYSDLLSNLMGYNTNLGNATTGPGLSLAGSMFPALSSIITAGNPATGAMGNIADIARTLTTMGAGASANVQPYTSFLQNLGPQAVNALTGAGTAAQGALSGLSGSALGALAGAGNNAISGIGSYAPAAFSAAQPSINSLLSNAGMAISGNPIYNSLTGVATGGFLNPNTNPALPGMMQAATQPLVNQYMTATAPQTDSGFERAGRYGSGAAGNAQSINQYNLGQGIGTTAAGLVNNIYNTGLNAMVNAGSALGGAFNTGLSNLSSMLTNAGNLGQQGATAAGNILSNAYQTGGNLLSNAFSAGGNLAQSGYSDLINALNAGFGTGGNLMNAGGNLATNALNAGLGGVSNAGTAYGNIGNLANTGTQTLLSAIGQAPGLAGFPASALTSAFNAPWLPLQLQSGLLGNPTGGSASSTTTQPYFQNTAANILGTGLGALQLGNGLNSALSGGGALSGLFGAGNIAAGTGAGAGILTNLATGVTSDVAPEAFAAASKI